MPTDVVASAGDTLCNLAIAAGFLDCKPLRDDPANQGKAFLDRAFLLPGDVVTIPDLVQNVIDKATEQLHVFEALNAPPVLIRFTHGTPDKPYRQDPDLTVLNISNIQTNKGGLKGNQSFPTGTKFDQKGHEDVDAFKIEVVDPANPSSVDVKLDALKPKIQAGKPVLVGGVMQHEEFTGSEASRRSLKVTCKPVPSKVCFRSPYLRLVVDDKDKDALKDQSLVVTDMTDGNGGDIDAVEILDQVVRASYERPSCPAPKKCTVTSTLPVGNDHKRVKLALHILKDPADGKALTDDKQLKRTLLMYMRQVYAQADMGIKIVQSSRDIVAPTNMFVVDNIEGRLAVGGGQIQVRVQVDAAVDQTVSITTVKDADCAATAKALGDAIRAVMPATVTVVDSPNPPIFGKTRGSADVLIGDPLTQTIRLTVITSGDAKHPVRAAALTTALPDTGTGNERAVGSIDSRLLLKNYDTGRDRIDLIVVGDMPGLLGLAFGPFVKYAPKYGHPPSPDKIANSFVVNNTTLHTPGQAENFYTTIPHEIGHVLMDAIHALGRPVELMGPGSPVGKDERVVKGPKRISDGFIVNFDENVKDIPVKMFRDNNPEVFTSWEDI